MEVREIVKAKTGVQNAGRSDKTLSDDKRLPVYRLISSQAVLGNLHVLDQRIGQVFISVKAGDVLSRGQSTKEKRRNQMTCTFDPNSVGIDG